MTAPNEKEIELIKTLRENLLDLDLCEEALSNENLIRWLRARNHSLEDAEKMFRAYINWFDEIKLESVFTHEVPKEVSEECLQPCYGLDHDGENLITSCPLGQVDVAKLMRNGYKEEVIFYGIQLLERDAYLVRCIMAKRQKHDRFVQISSIVDCEGLSWGQFTSPDAIYCMVTHAKNFEAYYPETLNKIIVINVSRAFTVIWGIITPFLSARTKEKIQIYGKDRQQWQEALFKLAPKESLPKKYGGILPDDVDILPKCHECVPKKRGSY